MRITFLAFLMLGIFSCPAQAGDIQYGYNAHGNYVPVKIDGENIDYGYNAKGDYVPVKIGNKSIQYGYNRK